jgi:hypothetical protein
MDPDHNRQPGPPNVWCPDIEVQAVLTGYDWLWEKYIERWEIRRLGNCWAITERFTHPIPSLGWLWWLKTIGAERRRRVRDSFKRSYSFNHSTSHHTLLGPDIDVHRASPLKIGRNIRSREALQKIIPPQTWLH